MDLSGVVLVLFALGFAFTNGFHDAANAVATTISTRALTPRMALALAAVANFVGTLGASAVASTIAKGIIETPHGRQGMVLLFAALTGAITWNLITWAFGLPSSSSHALIGGLVGAAIASTGLSGVHWSGVLNKVVIPTLISPVVGVIAGYLVMLLLLWIFRKGQPGKLSRRFRIAQIFSATFMAYAHGAQDSQKTVGVIALALVVSGTTTQFTVPLWVNLAVATVVAAGTFSGGARIIRTMGRRIVKLDPPQGFAAETTSATVLLINSLLGFTISTTHVITSSIMGVGAVRRVSAVRWGLASNIVIAWILTIPASALVAGIIYAVAKAVVL